MARQLLKEGYDLAHAGNCEAALPVLQRSLDLDPQPKAYLNLARCDEDLHRYGDALKHWVLARDLARDQQLRSVMTEADSRLASLEARMPYVTLRVAPPAPGAAPVIITVRRDGVKLPTEAMGRPLPLDPGTHMIIVESEHHADRTIELHLAERDRIELVLEPGDALPMPAAPIVTTHPAAMPFLAPSPGVSKAASRVGTGLIYGGISLAAAGIVTGTITGIVTLQKSHLADKCPAGECPADVMADVETARTTGTISTVAFIAAGAGLATAGVGLYLRTKSTRVGDATVSPTLSGAVLRFSFQ